MNIQEVLLQYAKYAQIEVQTNRPMLMLYAQKFEQSQVDPRELWDFLTDYIVPGKFPFPPGEIIERIKGRPKKLGADAKSAR